MYAVTGSFTSWMMKKVYTSGKHLFLLNDTPTLRTTVVTIYKTWLNILEVCDLPSRSIKCLPV